MSVQHGTKFGPWTYTCIDMGRRLTHDPSGWYVALDCLLGVVYERTGKLVEVDGAQVEQRRGWAVPASDLVMLALGHAARKSWATQESTAELRQALAELGLIKLANGRAA